VIGFVPGEHCLAESEHLLFVTDIAAMGRDPEPRFGCLEAQAPGLRHVLLGKIAHGDVAASLCQQNAQFAAHAGPATSYHGQSALEFLHHMLRYHFDLDRAAYERFRGPRILHHQLLCPGARILPVWSTHRWSSSASLTGGS
jgi:hypothetical protein